MKCSLLVLVLLLSTAFAQESQLDPQLLHHWDHDKTPPLNLKEAGVPRQPGKKARGGVKIHDISYSAPVGDRGAFVGRNGGLFPAYPIPPAGKGPFPAIIYGHW